MVVARALRDAGMEVIYLGHATPAQIASISVQEDVDLVGLSTLSGNHLDECGAVVEALRAVDAGEVPVVVGGSIPAADVPKLQEAGVRAVFSSGTTLQAIIEAIGGLLPAELAPPAKPNATDARDLD